MIAPLEATKAAPTVEAVTAPAVEVVLDPFFAHDFLPSQKEPEANLNNPSLAQQTGAAAAAPVAVASLSLPVATAT